MEPVALTKNREPLPLWALEAQYNEMRMAGLRAIHSPNRLIICDSHVPKAFDFLHHIHVSCCTDSANSTDMPLASSSSGRRYNAGKDGSDPMATTAHPDRRLTYDDFLQFPDCDGLRHEIIDGVHYVTPCPSLRHQDPFSLSLLELFTPSV